MKMQGRYLVHIYNHDLLCIEFPFTTLYIFEIPITNSEEKETRFREITQPKIVYIPTQTVFHDFLDFLAFAGPFFGGPVGKWRQAKSFAINKGIRLTDDRVDF